MNDTLLAAIGFDHHFLPTMRTRTPDLCREDDAKRDAHVAKVTPQLIRLYAVTPDKIAAGFDEVSMQLLERHPALVAAITHRDAAEIGRLLLAGIDARIKELAEDAAEDEAYSLIPERDL